MRRTALAAVLALSFLVPAAVVHAGVRLVVRHVVTDYAAWRKVYDSVAPMQKKGGVTAQAVYQAADDPNDVTVTHDFATADKAKAFLGSDDLKAALAKSGVKGEPKAWIVNGKLGGPAAAGTVRVFVVHDVADVAAWRKAYDGFDATRKKMGVIGQAAYTGVDKATTVLVTHDFKTIAAAQAFAGSDELKAVMAKAGVVGQPEVWFTRRAVK